MKNKTAIFKPNKLKNLMLLLVCGAFVTIGIFMLQDKPLMAWFGISFFGLGVIVSLIQFYPNSSYLKLNEEGFEVKSMFRTNFTKWSHVKDFRKGHINGNKMIFFDYTEQHKKWNKGKKISNFLSGKEGAVQSIYKISTEELIKLMITYQSKNKN